MVDLKVMTAQFELLRTAFVGGAEISRESAKLLKANLSDIYEISKRNDMAQLVGFALEKNNLVSPDDEAFVKFQSQQYLAMHRCEGMEYETARMREVFEDEGIDYIFLKGSVIRGFYPEGWMRTSSDIDVLVRSESLDQAEGLFVQGLGYKRVSEGPHDRSFFSEGGIHIELHFSLVEGHRANNAAEVLSGVWSHVTKADPNRHEYLMSNGMFYFYHIAHLAKHIQYAGSGMRPFVDLWLINQNMANAEAEASELLVRGKLVRFAALCKELSDGWMEGAKMSEEAKKFEIFIVNCGIYGSVENRIAISKKQRGGTMGYIFRRLFMPYDSLKQSHPALKKHKWLMPFFQVSRWFKLLTERKAMRAVREIKLSASLSREDVEDMQGFFAEIGLNEK